MIDRATVQRIKDAADILDVVGDYVNLVRRGANYMGLCPFHNERTPSFSVNKAGNFCHCFSCHKGGSPINFIMEKEGISYHDALLHLAKKYGIKVEERELSEEEKSLMSKREGMFIANEWAMHFFEDYLFNNEEGRSIGLQYLYQRKINDESIKNFHLGYAPDVNGVFINAAKKKGFDLEILKELGLIGVSSNGSLYERFKGRVIFPVLNSSGKVVAFGGRDLKGGNSKYVNSPESEIYKKSNELYGLYQAKSTIVKDDRCYLVEGYLDVISMHQAGVKNVVASSGTALTEGQIALMHRFTKNITLIYDGDSAGIKAALRGIDMLLDHRLDLNVLRLPENEDPDSLSHKMPASDFRDFIVNNETDIIKFKASVLASESKENPQKRIEAIRSIVNSLSHIPDKVKRDIYVQECSRLLNINEKTLIGEIARNRESILKEERVKRRQKDLNNFIDKDSKISTKESFTSKTPSQNLLETNISNSELLKPIEWNLIEKCIKYGFLNLWEYEDENGKPVEVTTIQYIDEELTLDKIDFSNPDFAKIFKILKNLLPEFIKNKDIFIGEINSEIETKRKEKIDQLIEKGLTLNQIKKEEIKLEEELHKYRTKQIKEFSKNYLIRELASHEDDRIRELSNDAFSSLYKISNFFTRGGNRIKTEEDNLLQLVLNDINVLKNGILDIQLKKMMEELKNPQLSKPVFEDINMKIISLLKARSQMAKNIGDRIISPKK